MLADRGAKVIVLPEHLGTVDGAGAEARWMGLPADCGRDGGDVVVGVGDDVAGQGV